MTPLPPDFYASWRQRDRRPAGAVEDSPAGPPERWLQQIWRHQRLRRAELTGHDGRPVRVLHPGFWNRGPGPDFQRAVLQFGQDAPVSGDVEIDLNLSGWHQHGHDRNARYHQVILHVVWDLPTPDRQPPVLALRPFLDAPLAELAPWLDDEAAALLPVETLGQCCAPLAAVNAGTLAALLQQAARVRLQRKAGEFAIHARHVGWERALWVGLLGALGYRHNTWPMRRLAEIAAELDGHPSGEPATRAAVPVWEARLLGLAGLLPSQLPAGDNAPYAKTIWDSWWRERDALADRILPAATWQLAGLRPANQPQRRLALAARWLAAGDLPARLQAWLSEPPTAGRAFVAQLLATLSGPAKPDDFWAHHWTLRSRRFARAQPLLGAPRVTDLALNVVLPWLHARATISGHATLLGEIERRYFSWPASEDNAVLKLARDRLFGPAPRALPRTAASQQGLLQLTRDFCDQADARCAGCRFPDLVRALPVQPIHAG